MHVTNLLIKCEHKKNSKVNHFLIYSLQNCSRLIEYFTLTNIHILYKQFLYYYILIFNCIF